MKKILLATTALTAFAAGAALAEGPAVSIGGYIDTQVGIVNQDSNFSKQSTNSAVRLQDTSDEHTRTDSRVDVKVKGQADNGLGYGGVVTVLAEQSSGSSDDGSDNATAEKTFVFVESGLGRVELGSNNGASQTMKVDASKIARATGGINGDFYKYVNLGGTQTTASANTLTRKKFIVTPDLPTVALPGSRNRTFSSATVSEKEELATEFANKITYYSPRISGVQVGASYIPNLGERGNAKGFKGDYVATSGDGPSGSVAQYGRNAWTVGLNYEGEYQGVGIKASAVTEQGGKTQKVSHSDANSYDDIKAYELGANLSYAGFTVGGSWATIQELGRVQVSDDNARFWTAGAGYEFGPFAASVTYLNSSAENDVESVAAGSQNTDRNKFRNISVGADYKLAPGLVPYVEVSFFDTNDSLDTTTDNDGSVVLLGTQLTF
jgi:predicted porin